MADLPSVAAVLATHVGGARARSTPDASTGRSLAGVVRGGRDRDEAGQRVLRRRALVVLFAAALRRPRSRSPARPALAPALLTLIALEVESGLGHLPHHLGVRRDARGGGRPESRSSTSNYVPLDFHHLKHEFRDFQEVFWSIRLLELLAVAGIAGAIGARRRRALFLATWFAAFLLVKGSSSLSELASTSYFRYVEPGLPAFVLLIPAIALPLARPRPQAVVASRRSESWQPRRSPALATTAVVGLVPLLIVAALPPSRTRPVVRAPNATEAPIASASTPTQQAGRRRRRVALAAAERPAADARSATRSFARADGDGCDRAPRKAPSSASSTWSALPRRPSARMSTGPPAGRYVYRIGVVGDYGDTPDSRDLMLLSKPLAYQAR